MVLLDTNVVSELMRAPPRVEVLVWIDELPPRELFVTAVTEAEVRTGIARPRRAHAAGVWRTPPSGRSGVCSPGGFFRSTVVRRVPTPILPLPAAPPDVRSRSRTVRSRPSPARGVWPWRRGTCGTSPKRAWK